MGTHVEGCYYLFHFTTLIYQVDSRIYFFITIHATQKKIMEQVSKERKNMYYACSIESD